MMDLGLKSSFAVQATVIANEFIDNYMASANGEYVKVYLYLLRHGDRRLEISAIADALNHTEADVKRALAYWEKAGVLKRETVEKSGIAEAAAAQAVTVQDAAVQGAAVQGAAVQGAAIQGAAPQAGKRSLPEPGDSAERMRKLSKDEEFSTLLYVAQQYLGKMFTSMECEKFAYLYDVLKMSGELLEYLSEYCTQNGHTSIRYLEKVAINWYELGITTKAAAVEYTMRYSKDISSVMKAFGLTNRNPGATEKDLMKKWFTAYGFDRPIVMEACDRTLKATQTPSFQYADKILIGWKEAGVKTLGDIEELDKKRQLSKSRAKDREPAKKQTSPNRFHNFEERKDNYDEAIWNDIRKRYKKGDPEDGTE